MPAQKFEIDLRSKNLEEVTQLLGKNGFSVSSTEISLWDLQSRGDPGPKTHVVWIEDGEASLLTVTIFNSSIVPLEPGMNLHLSDRPSCCLPGQDWFAARTLEVYA